MKKAAFSLGAKYGRGFSMCRRADGVGWSAPAAIRVEGGSPGFQIARSRGLFAGILLQESTLRPDAEANRELYGRDTANKEILTGDIKTPYPRISSKVC